MSMLMFSSTPLLPEEAFKAKIWRNKKGKRRMKSGVGVFIPLLILIASLETQHHTSYWRGANALDRKILPNTIYIYSRLSPKRNTHKRTTRISETTAHSPPDPPLNKTIFNSDKRNFAENS